MGFGRNLLFLRRMHGSMTQEELAEKMGVSRQTVSKWELDAAWPEMEKAMELCRFFSCTMDQLLREDMGVCDEAYSDIRVERSGPFRYVSYTVISREPEEDAMNHMKGWAAARGIPQPEIIGWDFPDVSMEQLNVHHMHGYAAACVLPDGGEQARGEADIVFQPAHDYAVITIRDPMKAPFTLIPNAHKTLLSYMNVNGIRPKRSKEVLPCYERLYERGGTVYMDVHIAADSRPA